MGGGVVVNLYKTPKNIMVLHKLDATPSGDIPKLKFLKTRPVGTFWMNSRLRRIHGWWCRALGNAQGLVAGPG